MLLCAHPRYRELVPTPPDEIGRCEIVHAIADPIVQSQDLAQMSILDDLCKVGSKHFQMPLCLISLVEEERQFFVGAAGLPPGIRETERSVSFCTHAVMPQAPKDVLSVPDTSLDPQFSTHPLVVGEPFLRSYHGAPLIHPASGHRLGTFCVAGYDPRDLSAEESRELRDAGDYIFGVLQALANGASAPPPGLSIPPCFRAQAPHSADAGSAAPAVFSPGVDPMVRALQWSDVAATSSQILAALRLACSRHSASLFVQKSGSVLRGQFQPQEPGEPPVQVSFILAANGGSEPTYTVHVRRLSGSTHAFAEFYRCVRAEVQDVLGVRLSRNDSEDAKQRDSS